MQRHNAIEILNCATDLTAALVNDSYRLVQITSNPRWQQRQVNRAKVVVEAIAAFVVAAWSIYINWADNFVASRLEAADISTMLSETAPNVIEVGKKIAFALIADIAEGLLPGVRTAIACDLQIGRGGIVTVPALCY